MGITEGWRVSPPPRRRVLLGENEAREGEEGEVETCR